MPTSTSFWNLRAAGPERVKRAVPLPCSLLLIMATASSSVSAYMTGSRLTLVPGAIPVMLPCVQMRRAARRENLPGCMQISAPIQQHVSTACA